MATATLIAPEAYLAMSFEGTDREYVDGEIVERGMPTYLHGRIQGLLYALFWILGKQFAIFPATEIRLAIAGQKKYRIPDLSVFAGAEPCTAVPDTPPLVAVEVASPDDRLTETLKKFVEYRAWGIENIWLVDPDAKQLYAYDAAGLHPVEALRLPQYSFSITLSDLGL
ncbi:MAG: Uma2 family endonuclease [Bryobacteraceae bacterium]|nr:Uma2 family endonuclease [Bryobacteraceae bacterium]